MPWLNIIINLSEYVTYNNQFNINTKSKFRWKGSYFYYYDKLLFVSVVTTISFPERKQNDLRNVHTKIFLHTKFHQPYFTIFKYHCIYT